MGIITDLDMNFNYQKNSFLNVLIWIFNWNQSLWSLLTFNEFKCSSVYIQNSPSNIKLNAINILWAVILSMYTVSNKSWKCTYKFIINTIE